MVRSNLHMKKTVISVWIIFLLAIFSIAPVFGLHRNSRLGLSDKFPPQVSIVMPQNQQTVSGTITLSAQATDDIRVAKVRFKLDGAYIGNYLVAPPYSFSLNTKNLSNGFHTFQAVAWDSTKDRGISRPVTILVTGGEPPPILIAQSAPPPTPRPSPQPPSTPSPSPPSSCSSLGITTLPPRGNAAYGVPFCPLNNSTGAPQTQILIGQTTLPIVWGQPFAFSISDKMQAMSTAYAAEMFDINPNYLFALAIKESRMNCSYYGGCFQITGGFPEVRNRYPLYFDANDPEDALTSNFYTSAVIASLYIRFGEALWESLYQWISFYRAAADTEARVKIVSRGYNRGLWDTTIRDILVTNRNQCIAAPNLFQCFPNGPITSGNGIALDHAQAVTSYCRDLMHAGNFYDTTITRQEAINFVDQVLRSTFSETAPVNWNLVTTRANDTFTCLQNGSNTISFRYDFKTFLQKIKEVLPSVPAPNM